MRTTISLTVLAAIALASGVSQAVDPPGLMNYQGVLRDDNDVPLDGTYDMVFRFFDDADPADPENEIFVDEHFAAGTGAVTVTGGLFDVLLGSGDAYDGAGTGDHPNLHYVFALHETVYLEVQVGSETLQPRMRVVAAPYAMNAMNSVLLGGREAIQYITTGDELQEKTGLFRPLGGVDFGNGDHDDLTAAEVTGLTGGPATYADFLHQHAYTDNADTVDNKHASDFADAVHSHAGSDITGPVAQATDADTLDTHDSTYFLNTSSDPQSKSGPLTVDAAGVPAPGITVLGSTTGAYFENNDSGIAWVANGNRGIEAEGEETGGYFRNTTDTAVGAYLGYQGTFARTYGILASGGYAGGHFEDTNGTGVAHVAFGDRGIEASGTEAGGYFSDSDGSGYAFVGYLDEGISAHGNVQGGYFEDNDGTSNAHIAYGGHGIEATGSDAGGYFRNSSHPDQEAHLATNIAGIEASGFHGVEASGFYGVNATGDAAGGLFENSHGDGFAQASLGHRTPWADYWGIYAQGDAAGGYFDNPTASALAPTEAYLARLVDPDRYYGVWAAGETAGGYFENSDGGGLAHAHLGQQWEFLPSVILYLGVHAWGSDYGGLFERQDGSGRASIGGPNTGVGAYGHDVGVTADNGSGTTGGLADGSSSTSGNGAKNFVQNHPYEDDTVIVYASLEGDEVGTYTRGTARLVDGEARVELGETFQWVTNPDIGLTAHVTPRGEPVPLAVVELTTRELVVHGAPEDPPDTVFDYVVYGLRIGFEESGVVREKDIEAYIPSMNEHRELYERRPELRQYNALERFKTMHADVRDADVESLDFSATQQLRAAIHEYEPAVDPPMSELLGHYRNTQKVESRSSSPTPNSTHAASESTAEQTGISRIRTDARSESGDEPKVPGEFDELFPVNGPVEAGHLLALDPEQPGVLVPAATIQDPGVVGIAAEAPVVADEGLRVRLVDTFYAELRVDAGYGEIRPGDLLTSSFTPGHAMRAVEIVSGTIVGKALEPLETGTGSIRVLVMPR